MAGHKRRGYRLRQALGRLTLELKLAARARGGARMRPSLFVIGAQKAGSTSLFGHLARHPQILPPIVKEVHYFDVAHHRGDRWYEAHFPTVAEADAHAGAIGAPALTFDATPYYIFHPQVAARIRDYAPDARIIAVLRDPIARSWSHVWHEHARSFERLAPMAALEAEARRLPAPHDRIGASRAERYAHQHHSYAARSEYDRQIERWRATFPDAQLLFLKSETLFADPEPTLARIAAFLGVMPFGEAPNRSLNPGRYDAPPAEAEAWLRARLAPSAARTEALLGPEFRW